MRHDNTSERAPDSAPDLADGPHERLAEHAWQRALLIAFGWLNIGVGMVGVVVPGLPTTVFIIIALWAFSKSSRRFQVWLWWHPHLGPPVRNWYRHKVIPTRAKILAITVMTLSFAYVAGWAAEDWRLPTFLAAVMVPAAIYVCTRRSRPPLEAPAVRR